ncbi:hypothetical protein D9756_010016 [Leucocoprinus leucothites]|uniref:F-box domain-containing protein n=1 Tax=Leucocoprinus leucothites TaxID=201217 RepID=A0A8H5CRI8_9AGAR|nr:hypothetical protein D9756_010016 [Leucoagaricus leucothites]
MDLPQEIIYSVIFHLRHDPSTLLVLCLVCRAFLPESRRYLYQKIAHGQQAYVPYGCLMLNPNKNTQLFISLSRGHSSLAKYIHTFAYIFSPGSGGNERICGSLNASLQLMTNLKDLSLFSLGIPLSRLIQGCTFELEVFSYTPLVSEWDSGSIDLHEFVTHQRALRRLMFIEINPLDDDLKSMWPATTSLPRLQHLTGDALAIKHLLPTCSPTSLSWAMVLGGDFYNVPNLTQKLENLRSLCLHCIGPPRASQITPLINHCRNLQILHISGTPNRDFFIAGLPVVLHFPNLRIFIQSFPTEILQQIWNTAQGDLSAYLELRRTEARTWFQLLHHFQVAYFQHLSIREDKCFVAYERGAPDLIKVEAREVWGISPWI